MGPLNFMLNREVWLMQKLAFKAIKGSFPKSTSPLSVMPRLQTLSINISQEFLKTYGRMPRWIVAAPGRVNLIGEHIDYNDGFVLPMAIDRYAVMAADRSEGGKNMIQIRDASGAEPTFINL